MNKGENNMLGAIFSQIDVRDYKGVSMMQAESFPEEFELPIIRVKNQGSVGSCVAHALSSVVEYYNYKQHNSKEEMSVGYIYGNRNLSTHKGSGMVVRDALATLKLYGDVPKDDFSYTYEVPQAISKFNEEVDSLFDKGYPNRISYYYKLKTKNDIKAALISGTPVVMAMKWYSDFRVVDGILTTGYYNYAGGHCMLIYGWNKDGWKVLNSWGKRWGNEGTVVIPYDMNIKEAWAVADEIKDEISVEKPFSSDIGKIIAKILNVIGRLFAKIFVK